jgi:putative flippase GtrA
MLDRPAVRPPLVRVPIARLLRFAAGSLLASATSAVAFALVYQVAAAGTRAATFGAFASGAVVNFAVNRSWTWNRRSRAGLWRDAAAFLAVAGSTAVLASIATAATESHANRIGADPDQRTILLEGAYFGTYAVLFVVKLLLLDRWVFRTRGRPAAGA